MTTPLATMTDAERMKLIKWARKNGAAKIDIGGVQIEFQPISQSEREFNDRLMEKYGIPGQKPFYIDEQITPDAEEEERMRIWHASHTKPAHTDDSTKKAMAALRSTMDDPDVFAQKSDEWANQTRLPR